MNSINHGIKINLVEQNTSFHVFLLLHFYVPSKQFTTQRVKYPTVETGHKIPQTKCLNIDKHTSNIGCKEWTCCPVTHTDTVRSMAIGYWTRLHYGAEQVLSNEANKSSKTENYPRPKAVIIC